MSKNKISERAIGSASDDTRRLNPHLFKRINEPKNRSQLQDAVAERDETPALDRPTEGKEEGHVRTLVSFTGYRVRPLDPDNFAGSVKDLLDGLRHSGIILGDEPWRISLKTEQVKVPSFKDEKTVIEVLLP